MSDHTTVARETPPANRHDTSHSWRVAKAILVWLLSGLASLIGFSVAYSNASKGDSDTKLAEFEASLKNYIRAAAKAGDSKIQGVDYERYNIEISSRPYLEEDASRLSRSTNDLSYQNADRAKAVINQTVAEYNFAQSANPVDLRVHSDLSLKALKRDWVRINTFDAVLKGLGIAAVAGGVTWIVAWLMVVGLALIWWFLMDRLRDIARAIKG